MERDGGRSETDLAQSASLRRADGPRKPLWHIKKKAPRGTCFRVCNVQVAEAVGFEPTVSCPTAVFKTAALNHSATLPWRAL